MNLGQPHFLLQLQCLTIALVNLSATSSRPTSVPMLPNLKRLKATPEWDWDRERFEWNFTEPPDMVLALCALYYTITGQRVGATF